MHWLIDQNTLEQMQAAQASGVVPSAEQQADYEARVTAQGGASGSRVLSVAGGQAEIAVRGVLTKEPDLFAMLFGGGNTTYGEIVAALAEAENDARVKQITLSIDSPGGNFDGLQTAVDAIAGATKPARAVVDGMATSAAFAIAAQADEIIASNRAARFGSIGVAQSFFVSDRFVDIASTDAPNKRPDVTTPQGVAVVQAQLDEMHALFVEGIARGRGTTVNDVNDNFGRGATVLADSALSRGMIDSIDGPELAVVQMEPEPSADAGAQVLETKTMDLATLKAEHPAIYAEAVQAGVDKERDRVTAHLTLGKQSGAIETAIVAVESGDDMTQTYSAKYMAAGMNRADTAARGDDDTDPGDDDEPETDTEESARVIDLAVAKMGG